MMATGENEEAAAELVAWSRGLDVCIETVFEGDGNYQRSEGDHCNPR